MVQGLAPPGLANGAPKTEQTGSLVTYPNRIYQLVDVALALSSSSLSNMILPFEVSI